MIVDTHVHIWEMPPRAPVGPTALSFTRTPDEPATAEELIDDMDAHGVDKAVLVQTSWSTWDNGYIADSVQRYRDRFVGQGLIDPQDPENASQVRHWMKERGLAGFRLHPVYYHEPVMTAERNAPLWEAITELGGIVQLQIRPEHASQVEAVAQRYPSVPLIVDHMAYPDMSEAPEFNSYRRILDLARLPNVYVKISDIAPQSTKVFPYEDVQGIIQQLYRSFGIERMMWGTGYPGHHREKQGWPSLAEELRFVREGIDWLAAPEKDRLLGGTAASVWKL